MEQQDLQQVVRRLHRNNKERLKIFRELDSFTKSVAINQLGKKSQADVLSQLTIEEIVSFINHLNPDKATDLLRLLPAKRQKAVLEHMDDRISTTVTTLLPFDPQTAAGMMNLNYIQVEENTPVAEIIQQLDIHERNTGRIPTVILVDHGHVTGYIPGSKLGFANPEEPAAKFKRKIATVYQSSKSKDVLSIFRQNPHDKVVVLSEDNIIIGIIYSDDVLRALREQSSATLYNFAGVDDEEDVNDSVKTKIRYRSIWLLVNLATGFLAAATVSMFDATISKYVLLAAYMPIVAGMGGNAATQTLAIVVRGISMGQIRLGSAWHMLRNEILAALGNGILTGVVVAIIVYVFNRDIKLALVLAIAMIMNLVVAAFFGTLIPLVMKAFGKDPATSATIFISTATDILGFVSFLGLATILLV